MMNDLQKTAIAIIDRQLEKLESAQNSTVWRDSTIALLEKIVKREEIDRLRSIKLQGSKYLGFREDLRTALLHLRKDIEVLPGIYLVTESPERTRVERDKPSAGARRVFIVHGHDSTSKLDATRTIEKLRLDAVVLHEQANSGATLIEKFEQNAADVGFAIVLLTPDDEGHPVDRPAEKKPRARQNVILELGYFLGALGRERVCVLLKGDVEIPSDYLGVVYVPMDDAGAWRLALAKEIKASGLDVDLNKLV